MFPFINLHHHHVMQQISPHCSSLFPWALPEKFTVSDPIFLLFCNYSCGTKLDTSCQDAQDLDFLSKPVWIWFAQKSGQWSGTCLIRGHIALGGSGQKWFRAHLECTLSCARLIVCLIRGLIDWVRKIF